MKIAILVVDRANYGRLKPVMAHLKEIPSVDLHVMVAGTMLLDRFGRAERIVEQDGFEIDSRVYVELEGSNPLTMAKSLGLCVSEFASELSRVKPDILVIIGDRYEALGAALSAAYLNICIVHIQGGEVSGSIDESARHAISKLAHYHFPSTERSKNYLIRMGEHAEHVFNFGCPVVDVIGNLKREVNLKAFETGVGASINPDDKYLLVIYHPTTTEFEFEKERIKTLLDAVESFGKKTIWLWPNIDSGADSISLVLRQYREKHEDKWLRLVKNFSPEVFQVVLSHAACAIGNSSSFVRDSSVWGTPVVLVGDRQFGRETASNVHRIGYDKDKIIAAINSQLAHGNYGTSNLYGDKGVSKRIADKISMLKPIHKKHLSYVDENE